MQNMVCVRVMSNVYWLASFYGSYVYKKYTSAKYVGACFNLAQIVQCQNSIAVKDNFPISIVKLTCGR